MVSYETTHLVKIVGEPETEMTGYGHDIGLLELPVVPVRIACRGHASMNIVKLAEYQEDFPMPICKACKASDEWIEWFIEKQFEEEDAQS